MLTVIVCLVWSGKSSTRSPLASRYSVIPSTEVTLTGFSGFAPAVAFPLGEVFFCGLAGAARVLAAAAKSRNANVFRMEFMQVPYGSGLPGLQADLPKPGNFTARSGPSSESFGNPDGNSVRIER